MGYCNILPGQRVIRVFHKNNLNNRPEFGKHAKALGLHWIFPWSSQIAVASGYENARTNFALKYLPHRKFVSDWSPRSKFGMKGLIGERDLVRLDCDTYTQ